MEQTTKALNGHLRAHHHAIAMKISQSAGSAEITQLRALLVQARLDAESLLAQAGIAAIERDAAQRLQRLLLEEVHHRSKNSLAVTMAIVSQSLKNATSVEEGRIAIESRLLSLSRTQDLLLQGNWTSSKISDVVRVAVQPFESNTTPKFDIDHCPVEIVASAVLPLSLSLNELCTNAVKYGALSAATGRVAIGLKVDDTAQCLRFTWVETGGPLVAKPVRHSFGSRLIKLLAKQMGGDVTVDYAAAGFAYELKLPVATLHAGEAG